MRVINENITRFAAARTGTPLDALRAGIVADFRQMKPSLVSPVSFALHAQSLYRTALVLTDGVDITEDWATVGPVPSAGAIQFTAHCMMNGQGKPLHQQAIGGVVGQFVGKTDKEMGELILNALFLLADDHRFITLMPVAIKTNYDMKYNQGSFKEIPLDTREEYEREQGSDWVRPVITDEMRAMFERQANTKALEGAELKARIDARGENTTTFGELAEIAKQVKAGQAPH